MINQCFVSYIIIFLLRHFQNTFPSKRIGEVRESGFKRGTSQRDEGGRKGAKEQRVIRKMFGEFNEAGKPHPPNIRKISMILSCQRVRSSAYISLFETWPKNRISTQNTKYLVEFNEFAKPQRLHRRPYSRVLGGPYTLRIYKVCEKVCGQSRHVKDM